MGNQLLMICFIAYCTSRGVGYLLNVMFLENWWKYSKPSNSTQREGFMFHNVGAKTELGLTPGLWPVTSHWAGLWFLFPLRSLLPERVYTWITLNFVLPHPLICSTLLAFFIFNIFYYTQSDILKVHSEHLLLNSNVCF